MATLPVVNAKSAPDVVLKSVFQKYDKNGDGRISVTEGQSLMDDLGCSNMSKEEFTLCLASFDSSGDKTLSFDEFKQAWRKINRIIEVAKVLETADGKAAVEYFQYYDKQKDGSLSHTEFRAMFENLITYNLTNGHTCEEVLKSLGGDGKIDFHEYLQFMGYVCATPR